MMEIVVSNLIDNALKYSDEAITITLEDNALHVKDQGVGIKPEELEKVTQKNLSRQYPFVGQLHGRCCR